MQDEPDNELDRLLMLVVDGELQEQDRDQLAQRLQHDPEARARFLRYIAMHAWLEWDRTDDENKPTANVESKPEVFAGSNRFVRGFYRQVSWVGHRFSRPTPLSLTLAGLVVSVLVTAMAFVAAPIYWRMAGTLPNSEDNLGPKFVASLTGLEEAVWEASQIGQQLGSHLVEGRVMNLKSGLAEITFRKGSRVVLQGPATFVLQSDNRGRLNSGRLVARVPPTAIGFEVQTPTAVITDLGTEFGVDVQQQHVETHVFEGKVLVQPIAQNDTSSAPVRLGAGESVRINAGGQVKPASSADKTRFQRRGGLVNLARGKPIISESASWPGPPKERDLRYVAEHVVDGKIDDSNGSYWIGRYSTPNESFIVDLGSKYRLERIELLQTHNGVANTFGTDAFEIWVSDKLDEKSELIEPRLIGFGNLPSAFEVGATLPVFVLSVDEENLKPQEARYVKFVAKTFHGKGCGLNEIRVFGDKPTNQNTAQ